MANAYENFNGAVIAAHHAAAERGYAFAVRWPDGHCTVEARKPILRNQTMRVVCCEDGRETLA